MQALLRLLVYARLDTARLRCRTTGRNDDRGGSVGRRLQQIERGIMISRQVHAQFVLIVAWERFIAAVVRLRETLS